ncbi:MAG TPA: glycosyltransferase [Acidimicrobiales bacterium]|nr:glycosyltransferase [Acidimicrobiales bacterium]
MKDEHEVDVVVPVLDGGPRFGDCLRSLLGQKDVRARIIVVDNGSTDGSREVAVRAGVVVLDEPERSSYAARNAGIAVTTAPVVAFTDADCIADASWLRRGLDALDRNGWDLCAGAIRQEPGVSLAGRYDELTYVRQDVNVRKLSFGATGNLFVRRAVIAELGSFDGSVQSGGDLQFGRRAVAAGKSLGYADDAVVHHPSRDRLAPVLKKAWRLGVGHAHAGQRDPSFRKWALSPRGLCPSPTVVRRAWRTPGVVIVDIVVKWTTWTARLLTVTRLAAARRRGRTARRQTKPVVLLSSWWPTDGAPHQAPFVVDHARALQLAVDEVWCWAVVGGTRMRAGRPVADAGGGELRVTAKVPRVPWRCAAGPVGRRLLGLAGRLEGRRRRGRLGAVVLHSFDYAGPYAVGVARAAGCPLIYVEHWSAVATGDLSAARLACLRHVLVHADAVAAVSRFLGEALERIGELPRGSVQVIDNIVDLCVFAPAAPAPSNGTVIAQIADFRPVKGHDLLVDALVELGAEVDELDLRFVLVGDGDGRRAVEQRVAVAGLLHRVTFTGKLSRRQVAEVITRADCTLLTSRTETSSCAAMESLVIGRPVIAPRVGALESLLTGADGILYERSAAGLAGALRRAARAPAGADWHARAEKAAARFAPEACAASYRRLMAAAGAGAHP